MTFGNVVADSVQSLDHVYWIAGGPCGGKTTLVRRLACEFGLKIFEPDFDRYQALADPDRYPTMQEPGPTTDWNWFFSRSPDSYSDWLIRSADEQLDFVVNDLRAREAKEPLLVDISASPAKLAGLASANRLVFLFAEEQLIRRESLQREDHAEILECIRSNTDDPAATQHNVEDALTLCSEKLHGMADATGLPVWLRRDASTQHSVIGFAQAALNLPASPQT